MCNATKIFPVRLCGAAILIGVFTVPIAAHAQLEIGRSSSGTVALRVCNERKVDLDVFVSLTGKVSNSHIARGTCAAVSVGAVSGPHDNYAEYEKSLQSYEATLSLIENYLKQ